MNKFIPKMQSTKQVFENLLGTWSIKRILGNYGTAEGTSKFTLHNQSAAKSTDLKETARTAGATANTSVIPLSDEKTVVVLYREDLEVKYNTNALSQQLGQKVQNSAYKEYVYLYDEERDKIIKKFTDGRLFYEFSIDFEKQVANGDHLCDKDLYKATYRFENPHNFLLTYDVKGPEKDYLIQTEFSRQIGDFKS